MGASRIGDLFQVGIDILRTAVSTATKKIVAQTGSVVGKTTDSDNVEWWQHVGFASRPAQPDAGKESAQAVVMRQGGREVAIASQDLRGLEVYGNLADGETCLYATGADGTAQGRVLIKADGGIHVYTAGGNASGGPSMGISVHPDGYINLTCPEGNALLLGDDGSIKLFNGSGGIQIKADGSIKIAGEAQVAISAGSVSIGKETALPVAIAPQTVTAITALQTQITALQVALAADSAALVACMNIAGPVAVAHQSAAAASPAAVAISAAVAAAGAATVSAQSALIPSLRTSSD